MGYGCKVMHLNQAFLRSEYIQTIALANVVGDCTNLRHPVGIDIWGSFVHVVVCALSFLELHYQFSTILKVSCHPIAPTGPQYRPQRTEVCEFHDKAQGTFFDPTTIM